MNSDEHKLFDQDELDDIFKRADNEWRWIKYGYIASILQPPTRSLTPLPENVTECLDCGVGYLIIKGEPCAFCALLLRKRASQ